MRPPLVQRQDAVGEDQHVGVVRRHDDREPLVVDEAPEEADDLEPHGRVELRGRLVGEHDGRAVGDRPRDRDALLLAAGQLLGAVREPGGQPHGPEHLFGAVRALARGEAGDAKSEVDVLESGHRRQQGDGLEDEPHPAPAQRVGLAVGERRHVPPVEPDPARGRPVQGAEQVQQGGLAGTRAALEHRQGPARDGEVDAAEDLDGLPSRDEAAVQGLDAQQLHRHSSPSLTACAARMRRTSRARTAKPTSSRTPSTA